MNWLRRLFGGKKSAETPPHALPQGMDVCTGSPDGGSTLKIDLDSFDSGAHKDVVSTIVNFSGCPLFDGLRPFESLYAFEQALQRSLQMNLAVRTVEIYETGGAGLVAAHQHAAADRTGAVDAPQTQEQAGTESHCGNL